MKPAHKDTENPPGQVVYPLPESVVYKPTHGGYPEVKTINDYIKKVEVLESLPKRSTFEEGYEDGYNDGIAEGFQRGFLYAKRK